MPDRLGYMGPAGAKGLERCVKSSMELTAAGLQWDSFCQDSTYPVVLHSLPTPHAPRPRTMPPTPAAFAITLQVITVLCMSI